MSGTVCSRLWLTRPSTSGKSSTVVPFACPSTPCCKKYRPLNLGDAENARPENNGQRKLWVWKMQEWKMTDKNYRVWKMQDWKMTDKLLANCEHNYGVWKMQEYKSTWVQPTHTVYIKEAVRDTLQSTTGLRVVTVTPSGCPLCRTPIDMVMRVYFWCVSGELS